MKKILLLFITNIIVTITFAQSTLPCYQERYNLDSAMIIKLADESDMIVEGQVISKKEFKHENQVYTAYVIDVYKTIKGNKKQTKIELIYKGGEVWRKVDSVRKRITYYNSIEGCIFVDQMHHDITRLYDDQYGLMFLTFSKYQLINDNTIQGKRYWQKRFYGYNGEKFSGKIKINSELGGFNQIFDCLNAMYDIMKLTTHQKIKKHKDFFKELKKRMLGSKNNSR